MEEVMKETKMTSLDAVKVRKAALILRSIDNKLRQRILDLLKDCYSMSVTDIYIRLRIDQSIASQHLGILRRSGALSVNRSGKSMHYSIDKKRLNHIFEFSSAIADL